MTTIDTGPVAGPDAALPDPGFERDLFLRSLIRELAGVLESTVGLADAEGFVSIVGRRIGSWIDLTYRGVLDTDRLSREQVAQVLVDLKARISGEFVLESSDDQLLEYSNAQCPFEDKVLGRESMCMMTSNVFGSIAADNLGYAKVELAETIARGDGRCRVLVHLDPEVAADRPGREYFDS